MEKAQWMTIQDFDIKLQYTHHSQTYSQTRNSIRLHTLLYLQMNGQIMPLPIAKKSTCSPCCLPSNNQWSLENEKTQLESGLPLLHHMQGWRCCLAHVT
jgi:hypothetical protein